MSKSQVFIEKLVDRVIGPVAIALLFVFSLPFRKKPVKPKKFLVLKFWALGDSVVMLPMIKALKHQYKDAELTIYCRERNIDAFTDLPFIDKVVSFKSFFSAKNIWWLLANTKNYDLVIDCEPYLNVSAIASSWLGRRTIGYSHGFRAMLYNHKHVFNPKTHMVLNYMAMLKPLGIEEKPEKLVELGVDRESKRLVDRFIKDSKIKQPIIGFCVGTAESASSPRTWALDRFAKIADYAVERHKATPLFIGTESEKGLINKTIGMMKHEDKAVNAAGVTPKPKQAFELISRCRLVVSNDTGPMHIAAAMGVKTIGLFGPNTPAKWAPYGKHNISLYHPESCSPCIDNISGRMKDCNRRCIDKITVKEVKAAVDRLMAN